MENQIVVGVNAISEVFKECSIQTEVIPSFDMFFDDYYNRCKKIERLEQQLAHRRESLLHHGRMSSISSLQHLHRLLGPKQDEHFYQITDSIDDEVCDDMKQEIFELSFINSIEQPFVMLVREENGDRRQVDVSESFEFKELIKQENIQRQTARLISMFTLDAECCVCYDPKECLQSCCGARICYDCYSNFQKCPICRKSFIN